MDLGQAQHPWPPQNPYLGHSRLHRRESTRCVEKGADRGGLGPCHQGGPGPFPADRDHNQVKESAGLRSALPSPTPGARPDRLLWGPRSLQGPRPARRVGETHPSVTPGAPAWLCPAAPNFALPPTPLPPTLPGGRALRPGPGGCGAHRPLPTRRRPRPPRARARRPRRQSARKPPARPARPRVPAGSHRVGAELG